MGTRNVEVHQLSAGSFVRRFTCPQIRVNLLTLYHNLTLMLTQTNLCCCQTPLHRGHRLRTPATDMLYNTNGHHQRTSSQQVVDVVQHVRSRPIWQQFYNLLYNKVITNEQKICYLPHPNIMTCRDVSCWALALRCGKFVEMYHVGLWHCDVANLLYNNFAELLWACPLVVSVGGIVQHVRSRCPYSGVCALQ